MLKAAQKAAKKQTAKKAKVKKPAGLPLLNFKATRKDRATLVANANKYAKGNLSVWLRYAGMNHKPARNATI